MQVKHSLKDSVRFSKVNDEEENSDAWLISYADMMTLIACFFILMVAFANFDNPGFNKKAEELSQSFNRGKYKSSEIEMEFLKEELSRHPELTKRVKITKDDGNIIITFSGSVLFKESSCELDHNIIPILDTLVDTIRTKNPNYSILVEGHSDPEEFKSVKAVKSSWELSAIRSARILGRFEYYGFTPNKLVSISKGDSHPIVENYNEEGKPIKENMAMNRRVMIKVIEPKVKTKSIKFGLGVYLDD